jgi:hypothetical protein
MLAGDRFSWRQLAGLAGSVAVCQVVLACWLRQGVMGGQRSQGELGKGMLAE